ncbi:hypothetical protein [Streptomyces chartreusis]
MRRIGSSPEQRGSASGANCPDIIELDDGRFVVIGKVDTGPGLGGSIRARSFAGVMGVSVGDDERAVVVPREVLLTAARHLVAEDASAGSEAQGAYRAARVVMDMGLPDGESTMPPWDHLGNKIKAAWVNAAMGVRNRALSEAAAKIRKGTDPECICGGCDSCAQRAAAASIDPRDPRSLDGNHR